MYFVGQHMTRQNYIQKYDYNTTSLFALALVSIAGFIERYYHSHKAAYQLSCSYIYFQVSSSTGSCSYEVDNAQSSTNTTICIFLPILTDAYHIWVNTHTNSDTQYPECYQFLPMIYIYYIKISVNFTDIPYTDTGFISPCFSYQYRYYIFIPIPIPCISISAHNDF